MSAAPAHPGAAGSATAAGGAPVRVLVVDDTSIVRRMVSGVLDAAGDVQVVGVAADGRIALRRIEETSPDVVTLDIEMPVMDGLATLRELRRRWPRLPVIMFSTLTERGARATLEALTLGANDYVTKPSGQESAGAAMDAVRDSLVPLVRHWGRPRRSVTPTATRTSPTSARTPAAASMPGHSAGAARRPAPLTPAPRAPVAAVLIGSSTGGPNALVDVLAPLPATFGVPVLVVQHMPPMFTKMLAERLNAQCAVRVTEAGAGDVLAPGTVHLAPGGLHMVPVRRGRDVVVELTQAPPENFCRPAVDPMFRAAAQIWGPGVLAVVLTGMGSDGLAGARAVTEAGGRVLAQDEATSVVWGMPGHVARDGLAEQVLPLAQITAALLARTQHSPLRAPVLTRAGTGALAR